MCAPADCGTLSKELISSELFGHVKGAFTGATSDYKGIFKSCEDKMVLLDEIGNLPLAGQQSLLRFLQDGEIRKVGDQKVEKVNTQVIAATNKSLEEMVESSEFRQDLYYRLNVFPIILPPLRNRKEDISLLANHFVRKYCVKANRKPVKISPDVQKILYTYP